VDGGAREVLAGRELETIGQGIPAQVLVQPGPLAPRGAPVLPAVEPGGDFLEIGEQHAVGDETRRPMGYRRCNLRILCHQTFFSALRILSGVNGIAVTRAPSGASASLTAFMTAPGAPAVPASPMPFAPSCDCRVGVSTWAQTMSGISPLIGTR